MDERARRLWAGAEAEALGWGGIAAVARATKLAISTVTLGRSEVRAGARADDVVKVRRKGGGRPRHEVTYPELIPTLERLVDPVTRGDPESPLRWTSKSTRSLAAEMFSRHGVRVGNETVARLLRENGYRLQATSKTVEGAQHPDRNAQFEHINAQAQECLGQGVPFISVDTKKKELVRNFKNAGREWQPQGEPELVDVHDFPSDAIGKAIPYGVYDVVADELGLAIHVSHFPPGTSKWNKIEHRLFSFITMNWRGRPLRSFETVVSLIGNTTTQSGLVVRARLDRRKYPIGIKVSAKELRAISIDRNDFQGDWNYV